MKLSTYLMLAVIAFVVATLGSDLIAQTFVSGKSATDALSDHLHYASVEFVGQLMLAAPFIAIALICAAAQKRAGEKSAVTVFGFAMISLICFYFNGYLAAEHAMLMKHWTDAALYIGLLPFLIGVPAVLISGLACFLAANWRQRRAAGKP